jgi:hypothetical protein
MSSTKSLTRLLLIDVFLASSGAFARDIPTGIDELEVSIGVLLQARAVGVWDSDTTTTAGAAPDGGYVTDFYIRRARFYVNGRALKKFTFLILLDMPNFGIRGNYGGSAFISEMHIGYEPAADVSIEAGLLTMPLSHLAVSRASYASAIEPPTGILFYNSSRALHETGAQVRALLLGHRILFRGGFFSGLHANLESTDAIARSVNPSGRPLAAGMLRLNLIGDETDYAFPTLYFDGKSRISIGVGGQFQRNGSNTPVTSGALDAGTGLRFAPALTAVNDYAALAADVFADIALPADNEFAVQADIYRFDWGAGSDKTGYGSTLELGYRLGAIEPEVNGYWFNSDSRQNSFLKAAGGFNYFFNRRQTRLSLEFWSIKSGVDLKSAAALHQLVFQAQVFF